MRLTTMANKCLAKNNAGAILLVAIAFGLSCIAILFSTQIVLIDEVPYMTDLKKPQQQVETDVDSNTVKIDRAIFYNIFVPPDSDDFSIVEEQLDQYNSSTAGTSSINYMLIGNTGAAGDLKRICEKYNTGGTCQLLQAVEKGDEALTLEALYNYCQEHPLSLVTYIHNKGSFHPSPDNTALRKLLTKSAFSDGCQDMPIDQCTVCAARFDPLPHMHFSGNMWTAHCSYIQKLIPLSHFSNKMREMVDYSFVVNNETVFPKAHRKAHFRLQDAYGLGRYSSEHWIGSHPTLKPCDVFPDPEYLLYFWYRNGTHITNLTNDGWEPVRQQVPWMPLNTESFARIITKLRQFWTEWFCGRGRLAQYKFLYGAYPDADSFVWKYYEKEFTLCPNPIKKSEYL